MIMNWINEAEAARRIGRSRRILRKHAKSGRWQIDYTAPNGRGYLYSEKGIEKMLDSFSSKTKNPKLTA